MQLGKFARTFRLNYTRRRRIKKKLIVFKKNSMGNHDESNAVILHASYYSRLRTFFSGDKKINSIFIQYCNREKDFKKLERILKIRNHQETKKFLCCKRRRENRK